MNKRLKQVGVVLVVAFAAAQLVRPDRANPATDPTRTIQAHPGTSSRLAAVLDRACRDCHSNDTVWPRSAQVAPASWLMAYSVSKGRQAVNFSEWGAYAPDVQRMLLAASCDDVSNGKMPGIYTVVRPETRLSPEDVNTICAAARQTAVQAAAGGAK
jgi:heme-binding protein